MATVNEGQAFKVGIVGGGRGGHGLLQFFGENKIAKVAYVVDPVPNAVAILAAREAKIPTFTTLEDAVKTMTVDFLFDVTGNDTVAQKVATIIHGTTTHLIPSDVARMLVAVLQEEHTSVRKDVSEAVRVIKSEIVTSLDGSRNLVARINQIMSSMQMLALNASIEAAKVGVHGKGFAVVADHMTKSVESVRKLTQEIENVNANINQVSEEIDGVLGMLQ